MSEISHMLSSSYKQFSLHFPGRVKEIALQTSQHVSKYNSDQRNTAVKGSPYPCAKQQGNWL